MAETETRMETEMGVMRAKDLGVGSGFVFETGGVGPSGVRWGGYPRLLLLPLLLPGDRCHLHLGLHDPGPGRGPGPGHGAGNHQYQYQYQYQKPKCQCENENEYQYDSGSGFGSGSVALLLPGVVRTIPRGDSVLHVR